MAPDLVDLLPQGPTTGTGGAGGGTPITRRASRRWLRRARAAWMVLALLFVGLFVVGAVAYFQQSSVAPVVGNFVVGDPPNPEAYRMALAMLGLTGPAYVGLMVALQLALLLAATLTGLVIVFSRRNSWWALFVGLALVGLGATYPTTSNALARAYPGLGPLFDFLDSLTLLFFLELFFLFPDGRFVPRWVRWPALGAAVVLIAAPLLPKSVQDLPAIDFAFFAINNLLLITMVYAQVYRYLRVSGPVERQQTKWAVGGMLFVLLMLVALGSLPGVFPGLVSSPEHEALYDMVATAFLLAVALVVPFSLGVSIMRYRLWDIDRIIYRSLIYVPLTALLAGLFSVTMDVSQKLFTAFTGARSDTAVLLGTLLVVTTFTPIKSAIQSFVDRRFKGTPDPRQVLKTLNQQMRWFVELMDEGQITQRALDASVHAFGAEGGAVYMAQNDRLALTYCCGTWNESTEASISLPLLGGDRQFGLFQLGGRHDGLPYSAPGRG